jgi:hypothetical protein
MTISRIDRVSPRRVHVKAIRPLRGGLRQALTQTAEGGMAMLAEFTLRGFLWAMMPTVQPARRPALLICG